MARHEVTMTRRPAELHQMRLFVQSEAESGKFGEVSTFLHLAVNPEFPPSAPSQKLLHQIFTDFCEDIDPN